LLAFVGFFMTLALFWGLRPVAAKIGLVDQPGGRKRHDGAIPLIGGLVIIVVFFVLGLIAQLHQTMAFLPLMGGVLFLLTVGIMDDKVNIQPWVRFVIQIWVSCYIVIFCGAEIENLGNLLGFGEINLSYMSKPFSVTCLVLLMNSINMLDGLDGLASGFMAIVLGWLMLAYAQNGYGFHASSILLLLAPLAAFLFLNMRHPLRARASVFLGDAGSLSLGLLIGFFAISAAKVQGAEFILPPVAIIWFVGVPVIDAFSIFFVRLKKRCHPFEADRLHLHYKLVDCGLSQRDATYALLALSFVFCAVGYFASVTGVPDYIMTYSWTAILAGYTAYNLKND
jgi:UDP-GlcNAc:undecaprenyl-phosphate GlcNAc-1-phosphate transferase